MEEQSVMSTEIETSGRLDLLMLAVDVSAAAAVGWVFGGSASKGREDSAVLHVHTQHVHCITRLSYTCIPSLLNFTMIHNIII